MTYRCFEDCTSVDKLVSCVHSYRMVLLYKCTLTGFMCTLIFKTGFFLVTNN